MPRRGAFASPAHNANGTPPAGPAPTRAGAPLLFPRTPAIEDILSRTPPGSPASEPSSEIRSSTDSHSLSTGIGRGLRTLARSWPGRILLAVGGVWALSWTGALPTAWTGDAGLVFGLTLAAVLLYFGRDLLRWLLYPVRRKLTISYLFIGLLPVLLLTLFFLLAFYVALGQFSSYALQANLSARGAALAGSARQILIEIPDGADDRETGAALARAAAGISDLAPGAVAWRLERDDRRITRFAASAANGPISPTDPIPEWAASPYEGVVLMRGGEWFGAMVPDDEGRRLAAVLAPLEPLLLSSTREEDLNLRSTWTLSLEDRDGEPSAPRITAGADDGRLSIPWIDSLLLEADPWHPGLQGGRVIVSFGFAPIHLIQGTTSSLAEPLAINDPALGSSLLLLLGGLGMVFILLEGAALSIGIRLARSITRSVETLSRGTERVRSGNFGHQVRVASRDQLGELASSFNIMTAKIADDMGRLRRAAVLEQEMETARASQARLLPPEGSVSVPGFLVSAVCRPAAQVGGDYYDLLPLGPRRLGVVIADVAGTGTRAAFYMAELKGLILALSRTYESPRRVLTEANRVLHDTLDSRTFITITYAVFDSEARLVTFARAGHSPLLHLSREDGSWPRSEALAPAGLGLALDPGPLFESILEECSLPLHPGEIWLLFTDGVSEAMNAESEMFGEERLMRLLEENAALPPAELQRTLEDAVLQFTGAEAHADDLTMVLVRVD